MTTTDPRTAAFTFAGSNDWERAVPALRRALANDPEDAEAQALLALALAHQKEGLGAVEAGRRAVALAPEMGFAHFALGTALYGHDDVRGAEAAAREALRLEQDAANYSLLGRVMVRRRRWKDALSAAEAGLRLEPDDSDCANVRALALASLGHGDEAERVVLKALERDPDDPYSLTEHGWVLLRQSRYEEALESFRSALRIDPHYERARLGIIDALKARSGPYRLLLRYALWIGSFEGRTQFFILFGMWFGSRIVRGILRANPEWWPVLAPVLVLYFLFAVTTWLAAPLSNLLLRLNPFGRLILTAGEVTASNLVAGCLVTSIVSIGVFAATDTLPSLILALFAFLMTLPIAGAFAGEGTRAWKPLMSVLALLTIVGASGFVLSFFNEDLAVGTIGLMGLGVFVNQWVTAYLLGKYA